MKGGCKEDEGRVRPSCPRAGELGETSEKANLTGLGFNSIRFLGT